MHRAAPNGITTAEELSRAGDIGTCELIRGRLVMMTPAGGEHGQVTMELARRIANYVKENGLGAVYATDTGFVIETDPDTVRAPDCAFIAADRVPPRGERGFVRVVPDLVVETISPGDRPGQVLDKIGQWLEAGCRLVWVIDPKTETATVYGSGGEVEVLDGNDLLRGGDVLAGFEVRVGVLFGS